MPIENFTKLAFTKLAESSDKYVFVYVTAEKNPPVAYKEIAEKSHDNISFYCLNGDEKEIISELDITEIPTLLIFRGSLPVFRQPLPATTVSLIEQREKAYKEAKKTPSVKVFIGKELNLKRLDELVEEAKNKKLVFGVHRYIECFWHLFSKLKFTYQSESDQYFNDMVACILEGYQFAYLATDHKLHGQLGILRSAATLKLKAELDKIRIKYKHVNLVAFNIPMEKLCNVELAKLIIKHSETMVYDLVIPNKAFAMAAKPIIASELLPRINYVKNQLQFFEYCEMYVKCSKMLVEFSATKLTEYKQQIQLYQSKSKELSVYQFSFPQHDENKLNLINKIQKEVPLLLEKLLGKITVFEASSSGTLFFKIQENIKKEDGKNESDMKESIDSVVANTEEIPIFKN